LVERHVGEMVGSMMRSTDHVFVRNAANSVLNFGCGYDVRPRAGPGRGHAGVRPASAAFSARPGRQDND
jgi:hypothetical protein